MRIALHPQDIVYATTNYVNEGLKHKRKDNIVDFTKGNILIDVSGRKYTAEVVIGFTKSGICELYDIVQMTPTNFDYKKSSMSHYDIDSTSESVRKDILPSNNVPQKAPAVNTYDMQNSKKDTQKENKFQEPDARVAALARLSLLPMAVKICDAHFL